MLRAAFRRLLKRTEPTSSHGHKRHVPVRPRFRPCIEYLEDRTLLSNYVPLGGLGFDSDTALVVSGTKYAFTGSDIQLGYAASTPSTFLPVYTVNGDVSFDTSNATQFTFDGSISTAALAGGQPVAVTPSQPSTTLQVSDLLGTGANLTGADSVKVAGVPLQIASIGLAQVSSAPVAALRGQLQLDLDGTTLTVGVNQTNYVYVANNSVQMTGAAVSVTTSFEVAGVQIDVDPSNPVSLVYNGQLGEFQMYGSVTCSVNDSVSGDETLTATMGSAASPGLIVDTTGALEQLNFTISADFTIAGLEFTADDVGMNYTAATNNYAFFGSVTVSLSEVITASASLGTESAPGITIDNGTFDLNSFQLSVNATPIGGFALNGTITYQNANLIGTGWLQFPGAWSVAGEMGFVQKPGTTTFVLNSIGANFSLGNVEIPIGPTGLFLTDMGAAVGNLAQPSSLYVSGTIGMDFGGQISVDFGGKTRTVFILKFTGGFFCDAEQLTLLGNVYVGGYQNGNSLDDVSAVFGTGTAKMVLDWGDGKYSLDMQAKLLDDTFSFQDSFSFSSSGAIFIQGSANMNVPASVPAIGGTPLIGGDFLLNYNPVGGPAGTPEGVVAGWTTILGQDIGFAYDLVNDPSGNFQLIGNQ
jgi:hypothetical protein